MADLNKKLFYINSRNRLSGTDSDFLYNIDMRNFNPSHCVVLQANIPKSFYMVQENNNTFTLTEENINSVVISIPIGNYTRANFKTVVQSLLNLNSPNGYTYVMSIPNNSSSGDTGLYYFTCSGHTLQSKLIFPDDNNIYELIGFNSGSTNSFISGALTSTNCIKMSLEDTLYIRSDLVQDGVLQEIYSVESSDFSNIVFQNFAIDHYEKPINNNKSLTFRFYITNEDLEPIDLNGLNFQMTIACYKKDNTNDFLKTYLKYNLSK